MKTKKMFTTNEHNYKEEIINGYNNYLIYNGVNTIDTSKNNNINKSQSRAKSSSYRESETLDLIFGNPFKKKNNNNDNVGPTIKNFQNKPRIFDDKLLLQFQLDKKNKFLKLKQIME